MPSGNILAYLLSVSLWLCSMLVVSAQPETILFREFRDQQGLPNNQFRFTVQDKSGVLWMGGSDGLAKYDGYSFTTFRHNNLDTTTLSGNNISTLFEDSQGRLWVGVFGTGVNLSDALKSKFSLIRIVGNDTIEASKLLVTDIREDARGRFWLVTQTGVVILEEADTAFNAIDLSSFLPALQDCADSMIVTTLFRDRQSRILLGTNTGLIIFDEENNQLYGCDEITGVPSSTVQMISEDREGNIWLSCINQGSRMYYAHTGARTFTAFDKIRFESKKGALRFAFDLDNRLWISEFGHQVYGYDFRDSSLFLQSKINSSVPFERFVRKPLVDHSGNVWIPCEGYLIYPYPKGFENYVHPYTFHQSVSAILGEGDILWVAYREKGMIKLNTKTGEIKSLSSTSPTARIPEDHIADILRLRNGNMLLVCFDGVTVLDHRERVVAHHVLDLSGTNRCAFEDSAGRIWIGGFHGLHLFSETIGVLETYKLPRDIGDSRQFVQKIVEDASGYIWFASDLNGIGRMDTHTREILQFLPIKGDTTSLLSSSIEDLLIDPAGTIWAATDLALTRIDPITFAIKSYSNSHGFQSSYINSVVCDHNGIIWASTNDGISSFDPASQSVTNYSTEDGLLNRSYYMRSRFYGSDGTIYFGGSDGLDYFHPSRLRQNPATPIMYLHEILVDNTMKISSVDIAHQNGVQLTYQNDLLEIVFSGLYYSAPQSIRYYYKMDGLNEGWIDLGSKHAAVFTDLKPGDYTFRAKAVSRDGVWSREDLVIPVSVAPPFFETLWFRFIAVCLLGALLLGIIKYREQGIKVRQKRETEVSRKISELEKRALQAQMNPHFIYNCMNSIQQFMVVHDFEGAMKYLTRFSRILRAVLNMSAQSRVPLTDEIKLIEDYLELENMRFPNKFSYRIDVDPDLNVHTVEIPPFFIQPQVENAIRHGLLRKEGGGLLVLNIRQEETYLKVTVEDNGIGRRASLALRLDESHRESKGLSIVQERLSHLHQANGIHPLTITDLYDASDNPAGTKVEVFLPLDT
jgi:ligand-binding sensor domain-containing protein